MIEALQQGDPTAFRALVERFQDKVVSTCHRFLHDRGDAEDVAQEVFIEVHRSIRRFRGESSLSTWIYRIAVTKSLDHVRKRKRRERLVSLANLFTPGETGGPGDAHREHNPDVLLETKERAGILREAVDTLPESQRAAITLGGYEGFSNREIADILETTVPAVESLLHRARKNLRRRLYRYFEDRT